LKTLKEKITWVYIFLVVIIAMIGISSVINFYKLGNSINGLMTNNYKSINAVGHMNDSLEDQNISLLSYINGGNQNSTNSFYESSSIFYKWFNIESNNVTEAGEKPLVDVVNKYYLKYQSFFPEIQKIKDKEGNASAFQFYNKNIVDTFVNLRTELKKITTINETAMFRGKSRANASAGKSMYIIMILSISGILIGFVIARFLTNKFLRPLYILKENMEIVTEGHIKQEISVISNDEIGSLTLEFNKMISRLIKFEQSTKGKLLEEKDRSIAIVKSISDPLIVLDTDYRVILLNPACEVFFDTFEKDILGKHFLEAIKNKEVFDHIIKNYSSKEDKYIPKIITVSTKNKDFYFDTIVTKVKNEAFDVTGMVVLFQNVTKLKKLEKTKTEFVSVISHELKTPLTSIMMGTSLIKNQGLGKLSSKQLEIVETIEDDTERLSTLVNDIIQLSKIESDRALFHIEPCSVFGIVENCIKTFTEIKTIKDINLYSEVNENLPRVLGDCEKISWVINNLISNAFKYTNAGDYITVKASVKNKLMHISVIDTGTGIPEEYKEKIFDKFVKVSSYNPEASGTGLGLAIAKEIVEIHKGTIWCESILDEGSTFTFTIPVAE
jgi:PAS domain S-box-containing protein